MVSRAADLRPGRGELTVTPSQYDDFTKRTLKRLNKVLEKKDKLEEKINALVAVLTDARDVPADDLNSFLAYAKSI
jgi:hypothetical protein